MRIFNTAVEVEFELVKVGENYFVDGSKLSASVVLEYFLSGNWEVVK